MKRAPLAGLMVAGWLIALALLGGFKDDVEAMEQKQYCEMVAMYDEAEGIGWPDFEGTFAAECNADGSVKEAK